MFCLWQEVEALRSVVPPLNPFGLTISYYGRHSLYNSIYEISFKMGSLDDSEGHVFREVSGYNACSIRGQSYATRSRLGARGVEKKRTERNVTRPAQLGNNRGDRIRTYGPLYPKQMRYQTALHLVGHPQ